VVYQNTPEGEIRAGYEDLKIRTKTHFVVVRGPSHAVVNVIGPDTLIHTLRRFWIESPGVPIFIQQMIHSSWCGKAQWRGQEVSIEANEGLMVFNPDTYLFSIEKGRLIEKTIEPKQKKLIRYVDGTTRTVERDGGRPELSDDQLKRIADLAARTQADITWALDDQDKPWLISLNPRISSKRPENSNRILSDK